MGATIVTLLGGCDTSDSERVGQEREGLGTDASPPPDLCGTWKVVELSATAGSADEHTFCTPITVQVPSSLEVVGNPQGASATLTFRQLTTPGASGDVTCKYGTTSSTSSLPLQSCNHGVRAGQSIMAQDFALAVDAKKSASPLTARVQLSDGSAPAPDAYRDFIGTTPGLAGVTLHVPASAVPAFSGVGLKDGPPFALHAFVAGGPSGLLVAGPSVQVTGPTSFGPGVRLTVPFDAAFVGGLPAGSKETLQVLKVNQIRGPLAAIDSTPVTDSVVVDDASSTLAVGLASSAPYLTGIWDLSPIRYYDGPLLDQGLNIYIIWAGDFDSQPTEDPRPAVRQFIQDLNSSSWYDILSGYNIGNRSVTLAQEFPRKDITGFSLRKDGQDTIYADAVKAALDNGDLKDDPNGLYLVLSGPGIAATTPTGTYCNDYCGYHSWTGRPNYTLKYGFVGHPKTCSATWICAGVPSPSPNGVDVDGMIVTIAHEIAEAVTDPTGSGWHGVTELGYSAHVEAGDKCAWTFTSVQGNGSTASPYYNFSNNGHKYTIQDLWVNADDGYCAMGVETVAIAATPLFAGGLAVNDIGQFSVHITNTSPVYLEAGRLVVVGQADGLGNGEPVPVHVPVGLAPGDSTDVKVSVQAPLEVSGNTQSVTFRFRVRDPNTDHTFAAEGDVEVDVRRAEILFDQASCTLTMPDKVSVLTYFPVTAHVHNAGSTIWIHDQYGVVALPLNVNLPNITLPKLLTSDFDPGADTDVTFYAYAPNWTKGGNFNVAVSMFNGASAFPVGCNAETLACDQKTGAVCGACGTGTTQCDGSCSEPAPPPCGCGGTVQCDGSCSAPGPANLGQGCGCGGTVQCDGSCSAPAPTTPCGCGGTVQCDGSCSTACGLVAYFSNIDDDAYIWQNVSGFNSDPSNAFCKINTGSVPRSGSCDVGAWMASQGLTTADLIVKIGNGGCGNSSGDISFVLSDGTVAWSAHKGNTGLLTHCGWTYRAEVKPDLSAGAVSLTSQDFCPLVTSCPY